MKYLKYFKTDVDCQNYFSSDEFVTPNVSYVEDADIVYCKPYVEPKETRLVCTYNVTDTTNSTRLCYSQSKFTSMEVDGVLLDSVITGYIFDTVGEHTVKLELVDTTSIGDFTFNGCSNLTSINIPDSVTTIGDNAFKDCPSLTSINIPNSVTTIGDNAFKGCYGLTSIVIPESVTYIGNFAFQYCFSLTSINIPNSVTTIGNNAFKGCDSLPVEDNLRYADTYLVKAVDKSLSTYTIKEGTKWIGDDAFSDCTGLTSINIPESVTYIGYSAFGNCYGLTSIVIPESVTYIGYSAFGNCYGLTSIVIPESVTTIGGNAFKGCDSLPVEDNLRYADTYLVKAVDKSLSTYTIKEGTKWIGDDAFSDCTGLTSINIPESVTTIGDNAFKGCFKLNEITCLATTAPSISFNTFINVKQGGTLKYPSGSDYSSWMEKRNYYLGKYDWTAQEI